LAADAAGRVVDFGSAGEFHAVQKVEIFLRAAAGCSEHVPNDGVGGANAAARCEV